MMKMLKLKPVNWIYTFVCLFYFLDLSHGGYQEHLNQHKYNGFATHSPLKSLVNLKRNEPYFDQSMARNITALVSKSAYLTCVVKNLGNKTVSWIRHRDLHILTVASYTYTTDQRFQTTFHRNSEEWTLHIKWVQKRDAGVYECQISSLPVISFFVNLNVIDQFDIKLAARLHSFGGKPKYFPHGDFDANQYDETQQNPIYGDIYGRMYSDRIIVPSAVILGGPDYFIDKGSTINLTCTIKFSPEPPAYIFWYFENEVINFDSERGGVSVTTENGETQTSYLLINMADLTDSGRYSCAPSNADMASIRVHVLNGEHPEAYSSANPTSNPFQLALLLVTLSFCICNYTTTDLRHCQR